MKKIRFSLCCTLSLIFAALMLFFTFFAWGWFSDARGIQAYFEIPVSTEDGELSTAADVFWMASPFCLLISLALSIFVQEKKRLSIPLSLSATLPLALSSLLELFHIMGGEKVHGSVVTTYIFMLLISALTVFATTAPHLLRFAGQLCFLHAGLEASLLILSFLLDQKLSQFYFTQLLPIGTLSTFHYRFFIISVFLFYLFYSLSLGLRLFAGDPPEKKKIESEKEEEPKVEEEQLDYSSLSLEDLGIEK